MHLLSKLLEIAFYDRINNIIESYLYLQKRVAVFVLLGITAFAQDNDNSVQTEKIIEDNRTLTPKGNAQLVDDVSDNENMQFITVAASDGNVFLFRD